MDRVPLNVRIGRDLREQLQAIAHKQNRTLSNLVETELKRLVGMVAPAPTEPPKNRRG
ncbi:hypothetical protein RZS08_07535 [Arthrospira platensis SPKY1]|nr:hypothetical protein [Arthrospira platensis SPKY1]